MAYKFVSTPEPIYVSTRREAREWADRYEACDAIGFDTETTGLNKTGARIKFFSFSDGDSRICAPVRLLDVFTGVLENPHIAKRMTNAKFDMHMAKNHGIHVRGTIEDTVAMDWLYDENRKGRHGLKYCAGDYLGLRMAPFKEVFGSVGSVDKEVQMVVRMHDALEAQDAGYALELLAIVGKVYGDPVLIEHIKKVSKHLVAYREDGKPSDLMTASSLLSIARKHGLCPRTRTKMGYVSDFFYLTDGEEIPPEHRSKLKDMLQDPILLAEAHEVVVQGLGKMVKADEDPLDMLELLVGDYASLDAWASYTLVDTLTKELDDIVTDDEGTETLRDYYYEVTSPFIRTLWNMERRGFSLDLKAISKLEAPMVKDIANLERNLVRMAGWDVNPNSPKQLRELFFTQDSAGNWKDPFGERPRVWSKGGSTGIKNPSTNKEVISAWADKGNPLAKCLQEHRVLKKLHGTYLTGLPTWADKQGRIHTDLMLHGTVTGRLSSRDPNLQNIPSRGEWGQRIRELFIAGRYGDCVDCPVEVLRDVPIPNLDDRTKMTLIVADYEQLEMRIMAHMSQDPTMIDTIREGKDLHSMTAALAGGYDYDEIVAAKKAKDPTDLQKELIEVRAGMKAVGFGLLYGIGAAKLGTQLGLPLEKKKNRRTGRTYEVCPKAEELISTYFGIYPEVRRFIEDTHHQCEEDLYVQTVRGRYRRLPDILSEERGLASQARRQSVNSIIQGSAADIAVQAMLNCEFSEEMRELGVRMLLQIHDELVFEVPDNPKTVERAKELVKELMENPIPMSVPILISMDEAFSWGEAK